MMEGEILDSALLEKGAGTDFAAAIEGSWVYNPKQKSFDETGQRICNFPGCPRKHVAKGLCRTHYNQHYAGEELRPAEVLRVTDTCTFQGCNRKHFAKGYCQAHYTQLRRGQKLREVYRAGAPCRFEGCTNLSRALGYCQGHYKQLKSGKRLQPLMQKRPKICTLAWCDAPHAAKGYCSFHYKQLQAGVPFTGGKRRIWPAKCMVPDCSSPHKSKGYCNKHYLQKPRPLRWKLRHEEGYCPVLDCETKSIEGSRFCLEHKLAQQKIEQKLAERQKKKARRPRCTFKLGYNCRKKEYRNGLCEWHWFHERAKLNTLRPAKALPKICQISRYGIDCPKRPDMSGFCKPHRQALNETVPLFTRKQRCPACSRMSYVFTEGYCLHCVHDFIVGWYKSDKS